MKTIEDRSAKRVGFKFGLAAVATAALAFGSVTPAFAADVYLGPEDITPYEIGNEESVDWNYNTWHIGSLHLAEPDPTVELSTYVQFEECSIITNMDPRGPEHHVQVLKGYDIDQRPSTREAAEALIESMSVDVENGRVSLQLAAFLWNAEGDDPQFTTFRNVDLFGPGVGSWTADTMVHDSAGFGGGPPAAMLDFLAAHHEFQILGVGFTGSEGAEVKSISFDGDTYHFGTGCGQGGDDSADNGGDADEPVVPTRPERIETGL
ncbi:MAG: hypothetical protein ACTHZ9_01270 [Leucobacter sp.]